LLPADHLIADVTQFCADLGTAAMAAAQTGRLVTFGVQPDRPETGYGYIQAGDLLGDSDVRAVARFVEKPDTATAKDYLASGDYLWNSGIFAYSAGAFLAEAEQLVPDIVSATRAAFEMAKRDLDFLRLDKEEFARAPAESIDYAVMEKTQNAAILPVSFGWSDIGSWEALWTESPRDESDNVLVGDVISHDTRGSYIRNDSDAVTAVVGLNDIVVVTTDDAVLVCDRSRSQDVKIIVEGLKRDKRIEWEAHRTVYRPWGSFKSLAIGAKYQVKEIVVNPGAALSLQYHNQRAEHWVVVEGTAEVRRGDETLELSENQSIFIDVGQIHRVRNPGEGPVKLIEVQSGDYLGEDDIVRLADDYARADT